MRRFMGGTVAPLAALAVPPLVPNLWGGGGGVVVWLMVILAPLLALRPCFWLILRPLARRHDKQAIGHRRYLAWMVLLWGGVSILVFTQRGLLLAARFAMPLAAQVIGVLMGMMSPVLTVSAMWSLGWARAVCIPTMLGERSEKPRGLIVSGPYRFVRNPMYLSEMCALLGAFLISGYASLFCMFLLWLPMTGFVIPLEEAELRERFGREQYDAYARRVSRLLPWLW